VVRGYFFHCFFPAVHGEVPCLPPDKRMAVGRLTINKKGGKQMAYTKPVVLAQNGKQGSFAAGCPEKNTNVTYGCKNCERSA
jgi:hypothetical protein